MSALKHKYIDLLVKDFQETQGKGEPYSSVMELRARLHGFEISDLKLLVDQLKNDKVTEMLGAFNETEN